MASRETRHNQNSSEIVVDGGRREQGLGSAHWINRHPRDNRASLRSPLQQFRMETPHPERQRTSLATESASLARFIQRAQKFAPGMGSGSVIAGVIPIPRSAATGFGPRATTLTH